MPGLVDLHTHLEYTALRGIVHDVRSGRLQIDAGSMLEVTGEYRFRLHNPDEHSSERMLVRIM